MADTFTTSLSIRQIETGTRSGTWGTETNTQYELLDNAFSYVNHDLSSDADATLTISDGSASDARYFFIKFTSSVSLTATRTITLAPDDSKKLWIVENATTGSQSLTFKQGSSGSTVTVANGSSVMIYADGAGATNGAIVNALTDLDLAGTTAMGSATMSGSATVTGDLTVDTSTLYVDSTNNKVGIGNSSPANNSSVANNLVVGNGTAGGIANYVGANLGWYAFSRDNANNTDAYDGGISYDSSRNLKFHTNAGTERMAINGSGRVSVEKSAYIKQVALTSSSNSVAWDSQAAANAYYATSENTTFAAPTNAAEGAIISVEIAQGATPYTVAWNTVFEFAASTAPTVTATANKTDIFSFRYNGTVWQEIGRVQNLAQT